MHMPKEESLRQQHLFNLLKRSVRSYPIPVLQPAVMLKRCLSHIFLDTVRFSERKMSKNSSLWASDNTLLMGVGKVCKPFAGVLTDWTRLNINTGVDQVNEGWILITGGHGPNEAIDKLTQHCKFFSLRRDSHWGPSEVCSSLCIICHSTDSCELSCVQGNETEFSLLSSSRSSESEISKLAVVDYISLTCCGSLPAMEQYKEIPEMETQLPSNFCISLSSWGILLS